MLEKYKGKVIKEIKAHKHISGDIKAIVIEFEDGKILEITYGCDYADAVWLEYADELTDNYSDSNRYTK